MSKNICCWRCGYESEDDGFCSNCDTDVEPDKICPKCGMAYGYDDDGCPNYDVRTRVKEKVRIASSEPYLAVKCSQCGGALILNDAKTEGHCGHCGTQFVANPDIIKPIKNMDISLETIGAGGKEHINSIVGDTERGVYKRFTNGINFQNSVDVALPRCPFCGRIPKWEWHIGGGSIKNGTGFRCAVCFSKIKVRYGFKKSDSLCNKFFRDKPVRTVEVIMINSGYGNGFVVDKVYDIDEISKTLFIEKK